MSPRDRQCQHLSTSGDSQLIGYDGPSGQCASARNSTRAFCDFLDEPQRRGDHQFSNLFGRNSTRRSLGSPRSPRRSELHDFVTSCWADASTEISSKNVQRLQGKMSPRGEFRREEIRAGELRGAVPAKDNVSTLIHNGPTQAALSPRSISESPEERKHRQEERPCWDTASGMSAMVELARRRRSYRAAASMPNTPALAPRDLTAPERKLANLASGQLRAGTGARSEEHDSGTAAAWAVHGTKRTTVSPPPSASASARSMVQSHSMKQFRSIPPSSPRGRKLQEMMTSEGIF